MALLDDLDLDIDPAVKSLLGKTSSKKIGARNIGAFLILKKILDNKYLRQAQQDVEDMELNKTSRKAENAVKFAERSQISTTYNNILTTAKENGRTLLEQMNWRAGEQWYQNHLAQGGTPATANTPHNLALKENFMEEQGQIDFKNLEAEYKNFKAGPQTLSTFNLPLETFINDQKRKLLSKSNTDLFGRIFKKAGEIIGLSEKETDFDLATHNSRVEKMLQYDRYPQSKIISKDISYGEMEFVNRHALYNWAAINLEEQYGERPHFSLINDEVNNQIKQAQLNGRIVNNDTMQTHLLGLSPEYIVKNNKNASDLDRAQEEAFRRFGEEGGSIAWLASQPSYIRPLTQALRDKDPTTYASQIKQLENLPNLPSSTEEIAILTALGGINGGQELLDTLKNNDRHQRNYVYKIHEISKKIMLTQDISVQEANTLAAKFILSHYNNPNQSANLFSLEMIGFDYDILQGKQIEKDDSEELEGQAGTYFEQLSNIQDMSARQSKGNQIYETILNVIKDSDKNEDKKRDDLGWLNKLSARHVGDNIQSTQHDFGENFIHKNNKIKQAFNDPKESTEIDGMDLEYINDIPYVGGLTEALYDEKISPRELGFTLGTAAGGYSFLTWAVPRAIDKAGAREITKNFVSRIGQFAINKGWVDPREEVTSKVTQPRKIDGKTQYETVTEKVTQNKKINGKTQYEKHTKAVKYDSGPKKGKIKFKKGQYKTIQSGPNKGKRIPIKEKVDVTKYKTIKSGPNKGKRIPLKEKIDVTKLSRKGQTNFKVGQKFLKSLSKTLWKNPVVGKTLTGKLIRFGTAALILYPQKGEAAEEDQTIGERQSDFWSQQYREEMESLGFKVYDPLGDEEIREI